VSARSKARKQSLDILYEADIRSISPLAVLESRATIDDSQDARPIRDFTRELIDGVTLNQRKIDELITTYSQDWDMDRMAVVDRNILRLAIYEVIWSDDVVDGIVIDEALTLARDLSTESSAKFIHGLLGRISAIKSSVAR
jgi:N utilization substance protein B